MRKNLSSRLDGVSESATLKLNAAVQAMKAQGVDVVNFTAGEPDFSVPDAAKVAVTEALAQNKSKYTPVPGIPELRQLIAAKTNAQQPSAVGTKPWTAAEVIVTNGGKQALFNAFMALLNPGDEVIIPAPYWLSYPEMVKLAGGRPICVGTSLEEGFKLTAAKLRQTLESHPKARALVINSPSNPTGAMYSKAEFAALAEVLAQFTDVCVLSDEIYDRIMLTDRPFCSFLEAAPALRERVITLNGMSKSAAMTGWRIGWSVADAWVTSGMSTLQGQSTSGINALAQWASVAALKLPESHFAEQVASYRRRWSLLAESLGRSSRLKLFKPEGAFYAFVGVGACLKPGEDSVGFCERALAEAKVALIPATPFGDTQSVRMSFALDEKNLLEGCRRLVEFVG